MKKKAIIFLAPTPPPVMGPSVAAKVLLESRFSEIFIVHRLDTSDRRPLSNIGRIDLINLVLPVKHFFQLLAWLVFRKTDTVYIPISQTALGFLKEVPLIFLARIFRKQIILHLHGAAFRDFYMATNGLMQWVVRRSLVLSDKMIVLSDRLKSIFEGLMPMEKLVAVPNGIKINLPQKRQAHSSVSRCFVILFLGNFMASKGVWDLLEAVKQLVSKYPQVMAVFAGDRLYKQETKHADAFVQEHSLGNHVHFVGAVDQESKTAWLGQADLFVFPSHMEGMPLVIIEALAAGLAIVATPVGAVPDMVQDGVNGRLVPVKQPEILAATIHQLMDSPDERIRMGHESRRIYEENYTEEHFVSGMIRVFQEQEIQCKN